MDIVTGDVYKKILKKWPLPRVVRPRLSGLINNSVMELSEPPPLDPKFIADSEENNKQLEAASEILYKAETQYTNVCEELEGLEKGNRWANRSSREPRMQQLKKDLVTFKEKKDLAKDAHSKVVKEGENIISILTGHASLLESYERLSKLRTAIKNEIILNAEGKSA